MRFSPRFLNVFFGRPAFSFFSGAAPSAAASLFAIFDPFALGFRLLAFGSWLSALGSRLSALGFRLLAFVMPGVRPGRKPLHRLLLRNRALARAFARACVGPRSLAADRQSAAMSHAAIAADFHQPLDVHRDFLAQIALHAPLFFDDAADLAHVLLGQILHAHVGAHARAGEDPVRADPPDPVDVGQTDLHPLGAWEIDAGNSSHVSYPSRTLS